MMNTLLVDPRSLLPQHKFDLEHARAVVAYGYPGVDTILPELLSWLQDMNWPVAGILLPFLSALGEPLVPHIKYILSTNDGIWKYWILSQIVRDWPVALIVQLQSELRRLATQPTTGDQAEEVDQIAQEILNMLSAAE